MTTAYYCAEGKRQNLDKAKLARKEGDLGRLSWRLLEGWFPIRRDPVLVVALDMELRQLLDAIELALDASGRPLRVLDGEIPRSDLLSPLL